MKASPSVAERLRRDGHRRAAGVGPHVEQRPHGVEHDVVESRSEWCERSRRGSAPLPAVSGGRAEAEDPFRFVRVLRHEAQAHRVGRDGAQVLGLVERHGVEPAVTEGPCVQRVLQELRDVLSSADGHAARPEAALDDRGVAAVHLEPREQVTEFVRSAGCAPCVRRRPVHH